MTRLVSLGALAVFLIAGAVQGPSDAAAQADLSFEVLVYGGTSAGVMAAYTAKMQGHSVLLVEPGRHLGGLTSGGLGRTDFGERSAITGLSRDFYRRMADYYGKDGLALTFEPRAAEDLFEFYVDTAEVEVMFSRQVTEVEKNGSEIESITLEYGGEGAGGTALEVSAEEFIDASYEGDLMARAGVSYTVGRESNEKYNETLNGVQPSWFTGSYDEMERRDVWSEGVSPYVEPGNPSSGLLPEIHGEGLAPTGTGDDKVQAYNFRMCLCQGEDRLPIPKPSDYNPQRYKLLERRIEEDPPEDFEVSLEATHHSPTIFSVPMFFAEVGSREEQWRDRDVCNYLVECMLRGIEDEGDARVAIGFGGGHYCPYFSPKMREYAFGHIAAKYAIPLLSMDLVEQMVEKSGNAELAILDSGLKSNERRKVEGLLSRLDLDVI